MNQAWEGNSANPLGRPFRPLFAQLFEQLVKRGGSQDPVELRAKIIHQADVIDDHIVDLPVAASERGHELAANSRKTSPIVSRPKLT